MLMCIPLWLALTIVGALALAVVVCVCLADEVGARPRRRAVATRATQPS